MNNKVLFLALLTSFIVYSIEAQEIDTTLALAPVTVKAVSYTHLRAHETLRYLVCRLLLEKKK